MSLGFLHSPCLMEGTVPLKTKASVSCVGEGLSTGTLAAVPLVLSLEPHYPVSPHMTLVCSSHLPFARDQGEWLKMRFLCVCCSFKRVPGFLADSYLSLAYSIPTDFHSQMSCGLLSLALVLLAREPVWGLDPKTLKGDLYS